MTPRLGGPLAEAKRALAELPFVSVSERGSCQLTIAPGARLPLTVRFEDEWLTLTCPATRGAEVLSPWDGLLLNANLGGFARLALVPGATTIEARADIAVYDGVELPSRLSLACEGLRAAALACRHRSPAEEPETPAAGSRVPAHAAPREAGRVNGSDRMRITLAATSTSAIGASRDDSSAVALTALLADAGWPFIQRTPSRLAVDLRARGLFLQALVERAGAQGYRARATLGVFNSPLAATRAALGVLLLTVSAAVRNVRGGADEASRESAVFIETGLGTFPSIEDTHHALSGLSIAGQMVGREVRALADERVARAYLSARGWSV